MMNAQDSCLAMNAIATAAAAWQQAGEQAYQTALDNRTWFAVLKPRVFPDGDQWCALYGENIQEGVAAFGDTPAKAAIQFDIEFLNQKAARK